MHAKYENELPQGWAGGEPVTKFWKGDYIHLYRVRRACAGCGAEISIDVTKRALEGKARNAGLLLRNCADCRQKRKAGGTGSRGGMSRPTVTTPAANAELESLRTVNATMKEELDGLYATVKELRERLGKYELEPAMEAVKNNSRMPWEGN